MLVSATDHPKMPFFPVKQVVLPISFFFCRKFKSLTSYYFGNHSWCWRLPLDFRHFYVFFRVKIAVHQSRHQLSIPWFFWFNPPFWVVQSPAQNSSAGPRFDRTFGTGRQLHLRSRCLARSERLALSGHMVIEN